MPTPDPPTPTHEHARDLIRWCTSTHSPMKRAELFAYVREAESTAAELLKAQQREDEVRRNLCEALGYPLDNPLTAFNLVDVLRGERDRLKERVYDLHTVGSPGFHAALAASQERIASLEREVENLKVRLSREWDAGFSAAVGEPDK